MKTPILLSLLVSTLTEAINCYFQERGQLLFETIGRMLADGLNTNFGHLLAGYLRSGIWP